MQSNSRKIRRASGFLFAALLFAASYAGTSSPAAAFGMGGFGRMGGFGGMGARDRMMAPQRGAGRNAGHPTEGSRGNTPPSGDRGPEHHPIVGGNAGVPVPPVAGGGTTGGSGVPPRGERRFVADEIIVAFTPSATPQSIAAIAQRYNLTTLESQDFSLIGSTLYRWRIGGRRSAVDVVGAMEDERSLVAGAQPNYVFTLQEDAAKVTSDTSADAAQYVLGKLQIEQAHQIATGKNIPVAVIDSGIDAKHPDLDGTIVKTFDALGNAEKPQGHGTAMAGAIAAHGKLLGIALGPQLLAARAFDDSPSGAKGTSFAVYKSLQWAADNNARVVNMSFAGPADPALHRMLTAAYDKGIVLIAAAGNAGPASAPAYPAADPDVIAVTATDSADGLFKMANRGQYIAVAAPGVDVLALAPDDSYQMTTGTSVAAAHVSGIVALLLELKPSLNPGDVRTIIMTTAKPLGTDSQHADFGAGLVNAYRAVTSLKGKPSGKDGDTQANQ